MRTAEVCGARGETDASGGGQRRLLDVRVAEDLRRDRAGEAVVERRRLRLVVDLETELACWDLSSVPTALLRQAKETGQTAAQETAEAQEHLQ